MNAWIDGCTSPLGHRLIAGRVCWRCGRIVRPDLGPRPPGEGSWSERTLALLIQRDGPDCHWCGGRAGRLTVDHVIAKSMGGSDEMSNLVVACEPCNREKGSRPVEEFLALRSTRGSQPAADGTG